MAVERHGGEPRLDTRNRRALAAFESLFNGITRDFPAAWTTWFHFHPIPVEDEWEARYFLRAWAEFHAVLREIAGERAKRERREEDLMKRSTRLKVNA